MKEGDESGLTFSECLPEPFTTSALLFGQNPQSKKPTRHEERTKDTATNMEMAGAHKNLTDIIPPKGCGFIPQQTHKANSI